MILIFLTLIDFLIINETLCVRLTPYRMVITRVRYGISVVGTRRALLKRFDNTINMNYCVVQDTCAKFNLFTSVERTVEKHDDKIL